MSLVYGLVLLRKVNGDSKPSAKVHIEISEGIYQMLHDRFKDCGAQIANLPDGIARYVAMQHDAGNPLIMVPGSVINIPQKPFVNIANAFENIKKDLEPEEIYDIFQNSIRGEENDWQDDVENALERGDVTRAS